VSGLAFFFSAMGVVYHLELKLTKLQLYFCSFFEGRRIDQNPAIVFPSLQIRACRFPVTVKFFCSKSCDRLLAQQVIFVVIITPCYPRVPFKPGQRMLPVFPHFFVLQGKEAGKYSQHSFSGAAVAQTFSGIDALNS
jgi:hypothetical protein